MAKTRWLDRRIGAPGPFMCLCLSEKEYRSAMKHLSVDDSGPWIRTPQADATCHLLSNDSGMGAIVCLQGFEDRSRVEVHGLLIHEAVHIWQDWCEFYGERDPAKEQEAYAIQSIAQELIAEFDRRRKKGK